MGKAVGRRSLETFAVMLSATIRRQFCDLLRPPEQDALQLLANSHHVRNAAMAALRALLARHVMNIDLGDDH